jgi:hypothetical protein
LAKKAFVTSSFTFAGIISGYFGGSFPSRRHRAIHLGVACVKMLPKWIRKDA